MKATQIIPLVLTLTLCSAPAAIALKFGVAATIDGAEISEYQLQKSVDAYLQEEGTNVGAIRDPKRFKEVREKVLNVLIGQELLWQAANRAQTLVDDETLDQAMQQYIAGFRDETQFEIKIKEGGFNRESFRENLRQQLSAKMWVYQNVLPDVKVSDEEIHEFYESNKSSFLEPKKVKARHILIKAALDASEEEKQSARDKLLDLRKQLEAGADFIELAKKESQGPSAPRGGDLGYFERGQMVRPFEEAAFSMEKGELSDIVQTRFGFHLIKLEDIKPPRQMELEELSSKIHDLLWQQKSQAAVEQAIADLRAEASIETSDM